MSNRQINVLTLGDHDSARVAELPQLSYHDMGADLERRVTYTKSYMDAEDWADDLVQSNDLDSQSEVVCRGGTIPCPCGVII